MSAQRLYRLVVTLPEGSDNEDWYPEGFDTERAWSLEPDTGAPYMEPWRWPQRRLYLSRSGAEAKAKKLRGWGATVEIERSAAVTWLADSDSSTVGSAASCGCAARVAGLEAALREIGEAVVLEHGRGNIGFEVANRLAAITEAALAGLREPV